MVALETMYDEGTTTDHCDHHHPEASVAGMTIGAETEALIDTTVVDGVHQDHHSEGTADIGVEVLEAVTWMTKQIFQSNEEILGAFQRFN